MRCAWCRGTGGRFEHRACNSESFSLSATWASLCVGAGSEAGGEPRTGVSSRGSVRERLAGGVTISCLRLRLLRRASRTWGCEDVGQKIRVAGCEEVRSGSGGWTCGECGMTTPATSQPLRRSPRRR